jgi:hypothetical protein
MTFVPLKTVHVRKSKHTKAIGTSTYLQELSLVLEAFFINTRFAKFLFNAPFILFKKFITENKLLAIHNDKRKPLDLNLRCGDFC